MSDLKAQYLADNRPWVIGFSGGKDSTCTLQMVFQMLTELPAEKRNKVVHVLSSDTLVEAPLVGNRQKRICGMIAKAAEVQGLPVSVEVLRPAITDTFWVNLIGRGYPSPNKWFRWCTHRLKIKPMNQYILSHIKENGEVLILLGARKSESASRSQTMAKHEIDNSKLRKHGSIVGAFVYTPIEDMSEAEVWEYLLSVESPWGDDNRDLKSMYQKNDSEEISFIIDEKSPPSGHSRFGCWTCTVVDKDRALESLIKDGHPEYAPLRDFRDKLKRVRDDPEWREEYRKTQRIDKFIADCKNESLDREIHNGFESMGPFKIEKRKELLEELLTIQADIQRFDETIELISPEEIKAIHFLWMYEGYDILETDSNSIDSLVDRLLLIEDDMSDLSKRVGIFKKLETVLLEFTMNQMVIENKADSKVLDR